MFARTAVLIFAMLFASRTLWSQQDPLIGAWKLNLSKTKYEPGPALRAQTQKYEPAGKDTLKRTADGVDAKGQPTHEEASIIFDGKEHPVPNSPTADAVVNRRLDAYATEMVQTKGGMLAIVVQRFVSRDGKSLTIKRIGIDAQGKPFRDIQVYDQQ